MKYLNFLLIASMLLVAVSCKKQVPHVNETSTPNYLALNERQSFDVGGETITCLLDGIIGDSRCPIKAVCVWQGAAVARFKVRVNSTESTITLATTKFGEYDTNTVVSGFKIELTDVSPYPELGKPSNYDDYVAEVKITKL